MAEPDPAAGLLAGFDAGQTRTRCCLAVVEGAGRVALPLRAQGEGPGVSHLAAPGGSDRFGRALRTSLAAARARLAATGDHRAVWPLQAAAIGASGIEAGSEVAVRGLDLAAAALGLGLARLVVTGDERTALRGAFPDGAGVVVISGTGSIAVGRDGAGREERCGGWGWLLDGAGSAMDIGRDGLARSLRMADGRDTPTPLRAALWGALGLDPDDPRAPQRIKAAVVAPDFGPAGFAALAPVVERLAASDPVADAILAANAAALAEMAAAVARRLRLPAAPVCATGGAIDHLPRFRSRFVAALATFLPDGLWRPAGVDPCAGALAIAHDRLVGAARG